MIESFNTFCPTYPCNKQVIFIRFHSQYNVILLIRSIQYVFFLFYSVVDVVSFINQV